MRAKLNLFPLLVAATFSCAQTEKFNPQEVVVNSLTTLLDGTNTTKAMQGIRTYFSRDYVQHTDTKELNYDSFVQHISEQKVGLLKSDVRIETIIGPVEASANASIEYQVGTQHYVTLEYSNETVSAEVLSLYGLRDGKIVECHEVTTQK